MTIMSFERYIYIYIYIYSCISSFVIPGISVIFSAGTLIFLILSGKEKNIFKRKFSERLIVYLAVADILYR